MAFVSSVFGRAVVSGGSAVRAAQKMQMVRVTAASPFAPCAAASPAGLYSRWCATNPATAGDSYPKRPRQTSPRALPVAERMGTGTPQDKMQRKIGELKSALLGDYKGQELTQRQKDEWQNVVDSMEELRKLDEVIIELDGEDEEDLTVEVATNCEVGEDNEYLGDGLDAMPPSTPYDQAPALTFETDAWEYERPTFMHLNMAQVQADAEMLKASFVGVEAKPTDILRFESRQYFELNPGPSSAFKEIKIILRFFTADLGLDEAAEAKLAALVGPRYNQATGEVKLVSARYPTAEMNKEYLKILLARLVREAKVPQ